jgi:hypothetical protein
MVAILLKTTLMVILIINITACQTIPPDGYAARINKCGGTTTTNWINGLPNGPSTVTCSSGEKLEGLFLNGLAINGTSILPNGDKYVGDFQSGLRHGNGTFYYLNGDRYDGEFRNDKLNGQGTYS